MIDIGYFIWYLNRSKKVVLKFFLLLFQVIEILKLIS